jgi:hypothetical protein
MISYRPWKNISVSDVPLHIQGELKAFLPLILHVGPTAHLFSTTLQNPIGGDRKNFRESVVWLNQAVQAQWF